MSFLLKLLLGCYVGYEAITMIIILVTMIFFRNKLGDKHFNHFMYMQNGYGKIVKNTIKSTFKILVSICMMNLL